MKKRDIKVKKIQKLISENSLAIFLIIIAVLLRLIPHPANFAPIGAIALFGGTYLKKNQAIWLPLAAIAISDLFIGLHSVIAFTWGSYLLIALLGRWLRNHKNAINVVIATLAGSLLFFFVTNFGVWAITPLYAKNSQGLVECFVMAIPFFRNTLFSDLFFVGVLFGVYETMGIILRRGKTVGVRE